MADLVNTNPHYVGHGNYKTPCERCGVKQLAQFCTDCRRVDPDMTAGGRNAREHRAHLSARQREIDQVEFFAWLYRLQPRTRDLERRAS